MTALASFLHARAVGELLGVGLAPDEKALMAGLVARDLPTPPNVMVRGLSAEPILHRNPFDHVTGSLVPLEGAPAAVAGGPDGTDPVDAPPCEGVTVRVIMASGDPDWSFASFAGGPKSVLARRGDEVNGRSVRFVGWDRVWLEAEGALCQAKLFDKNKKPTPTPPAPPPITLPRRGAPSLDASIAKGIQKLSATEFNIDRSVVDRILENQADLMRQARVVPEKVNGRIVGVKLLGVRKDALLGVLGMENGDRLQTINGFDMANPERALEAYARLRTADKLTINVNRAGKDMNIDYNIR